MAMKAETFICLMQDVVLLTLHHREQLRERLNEQDGQQQVLSVIESQTRCCPRCHATAVCRYGKVSGLQRYRCQTCKRTFNALTGTSLARLRKKDKWLNFSDALVASQTLRQAATAIGVHRNTTLRWRHRFLQSIKDDRAPKLQGVTEADETYFLESQKGCRQLKRPARRRGGKACKAGLSNEQVCVLVARDRTGQTLDWVTGRGQITKAQLGSVLQPVLASDVLLVSDGNPTYRYFAQDKGITHDAINLSAGERVKGAIHIQNVNAYHGRLKQWVSRFHGVATHYLDNYLGWFRALDNHHANSEAYVLAMALGKFPHLTVT
jgi:transposase-like protein